MKQVTRIVSTGEFWNFMCKPGAYRVSRNKIAVGNDIIWCSQPPELVDGLIESKINEIEMLLKPRKNHFSAFIVILFILGTYITVSLLAFIIPT